jgi:hypothetical protein
VEAGFASNSTITLVSVPAALLAYLAPDPAILLLGTIWSKNLVSEHRGEKNAVPSTTRVPASSTKSVEMKAAQAQDISIGIPRMATNTQSSMLRSQEGMELQFIDPEKRFVLAEAIKKSTIPVEKLLSVLAQDNVRPDWEHMLLPNGKFCNP